jgi:type 1 glutamine amidotransferase/sugar phosphate isomerase/epimerase
VNYMTRIAVAVASLAVATIAFAQNAGRVRIVNPNEIPPSVSVRTADARHIRGTMVGVLGWRLGIRADAFGSLSFVEAAIRADAAGLAFVEGMSTQRVSQRIPKNLDYNLSPEDVATVKYRLAELRLGMPAYYIDAIPEDETSRRKLFEFARELGVETIVTSSAFASLAGLDQMAGSFQIAIALTGRRPNSIMNAIAGRSGRIGVGADIGGWMEEGLKPADTLAVLKDRLMTITLRDRSHLGVNGQNVALGTGVADLPQLLAGIGKLEPPVVLEWPMSCTDCISPRPNVKPVFFILDPSGAADPAKYLANAIDVFEKAARPVQGQRVDEMSRKTPITKTDTVPADERKRIEAALPKQALAKPKKPRKLLVLDLNVTAFYHTTIAHVNLAVELMGKRTGAYEAIFSNDLDNLKYPTIKDYDAIFMNNVGGAVFADPAVLDGLVRYVKEGGGLAGFHGTTFASQDQPEFGELMGAQEGAHQYNGEPGGLKIDDPRSPLTKQFGGKGFDWYDEFYHFPPTGPYSREKVHVLLSVDTAKADTRRWHVRPDNDYAMVWVKSYGKGRVFNSAIGHRPWFFANPDLAQMIFGGIQFVLGDLDVDTTPSATVAAKK